MPGHAAGTTSAARGCQGRSVLRAEQEPSRRQVSAEEAGPPSPGQLPLYVRSTPAPCPTQPPPLPCWAPPGSETLIPRHLVAMFPTFGTPPPRPGRTRGAGLTRSPTQDFGCRWGGSRKKCYVKCPALGGFSGFSLPPTPILPEGGVPSTPAAASKHSQPPATFLSREEGSCAFQTANLPLKERISSRRSDRPSPPLAELHPSCPPAPGFSASNGSFPKGRHEALFPPEPRPRRSEATGIS